MLGYFCSFRVLEPHLLNDRTKAVDDKIEVFNAINIRSVENLEIRNNIFDEILFLIASRNDREFGLLNDFVANGDIDSKRCMIRR